MGSALGGTALASMRAQIAPQTGLLSPARDWKVYRATSPAITDLDSAKHFWILVIFGDHTGQWSQNGFIIGLRGCFWDRSAFLFEPDPLGWVLGPSLAANPQTSRKPIIYIFSFLF
jgi:hypothetical protein